LQTWAALSPIALPPSLVGALAVIAATCSVTAPLYRHSVIKEQTYHADISSCKTVSAVCQCCITQALAPSQSAVCLPLSLPSDRKEQWLPKIDAPTIAEHVSRREAEILDAAVDLFAKQGLTDTSMAEIADAVGVARSAIYRYFPSKEHILLTSFERRIPETIAAADRAVAQGTTPLEKLERWLTFQVDYSVDPAHEIGRRIQVELHRLPVEFQEAVAAGHSQLWATLDELVESVLTVSGDMSDAGLVAQMIGGLLNATTLWSMEGGDPEVAKSLLLEAVRRILD
jgi:AcrR family transcriptional regulator